MMPLTQFCEGGQCRSSSREWEAEMLVPPCTVNFLHPKSHKHTHIAFSIIFLLLQQLNYPPLRTIYKLFTFLYIKNLFSSIAHILEG